MNTFDGYSPLLIVHFSSFDVLTPYRPFSAKLFHPSVNLPVMEEMMFEKVSRFTRRTFFKGAGTAVATTALLGQNTLSAYAASSSSQEALQSSASGVGLNVVLVHGSFVDASSWSKVVALLQTQQYNALAVQIPLTSLADDIAVTRQALASISGPTILVGHSYAGMVITNAGTNVRSEEHTSELQSRQYLVCRLL